MAVIGAPVTDDALFGIPAPDYNSDEEDNVEKGSSKQSLAATFSNDSSNSSGSAAGPKLSPPGADVRDEERVADDGQTEEKQIKNTTDDDLGVPKPDCSSEEEERNNNNDVTIKINKDDVTNDDDKPQNDVKRNSDSLSPVATDSTLSPDLTCEGLTLQLEEKNRGSFRGSGSRSPISPTMGVSHEHVAVDPVLIEAKKIPVAPSLTKEQKELQRELQFKQKQGNMLEKKPELKKVMDDRKHKMKKEEAKKEQENKPSTFSVKLGLQAKKLMQLEEQEEKKKPAKSVSSSNDKQLDEFKQIHSKIHKNNKLTS